MQNQLQVNKLKEASAYGRGFFLLSLFNSRRDALPVDRHKHSASGFLRKRVGRPMGSTFEHYIADFRGPGSRSSIFWKYARIMFLLTLEDAHRCCGNRSGRSQPCCNPGNASVYCWLNLVAAVGLEPTTYGL